MRIPVSIRSLLAAALATTLITPLAQGQLQLPRVSPKATVTQTIGLTELTVTYSRPGVKGRVIWGELVPYDTPWRTGANEATTFTTTSEIDLGGKKLAAGTYSLLTIPGKDAWVVVLNSEKDLWGAYEYKADKDVLRLTVKPTSADHLEWMRFSFEDLTPNSANLVLGWEKLRLSVPVTVDATGMALANARSAIASLKPDDWRTPYQAANYSFTNDVATEEGRQWLDRSLAIQQTYSNLTLLARWQMKAGQKKEAVATAKKAIAAGKASKETVDTSATEKLVAEWTATK